VSAARPGKIFTKEMIDLGLTQAPTNRQNVNPVDDPARRSILHTHFKFCSAYSKFGLVVNHDSEMAADGTNTVDSP
jgi:hypothetical protein